MLRETVLVWLGSPDVRPQTIGRVVEDHVAFGTVKDWQRFVGGVCHAYPVSNPVIRSPKGQHASILIEAVILFAEPVDHLTGVKLIAKIDRRNLAICTKTESQVHSADFSYFISSGIKERDRKRLLVDHDLTVGALDRAGD